jgi:sugar (pentulose or hexulose) kinase
MIVYAVDVGTTNIKVALFDERLRRLALTQAPVTYDRGGARVEFNPQRLFDLIVELMQGCSEQYGDTARHDAIIALTGQAESLVLRNAAGALVRPGISWLDARATAEAVELAEEFGSAQAFAITGEPEASATWPAAKLRWLARHDPDALDQAQAVLMVKDDIIFRLTGVKAGEVTTRGFTYLYDVPGQRYWQEMLDFCAVRTETLPVIVDAGKNVGPVVAEVLDRLPAAASYRVNTGALDHFCAMVGTGSYAYGIVSESAGTVLSLSMLARGWTFDPARRVSFHAGLRPGEILLFSGADSGGVVLDWFRNTALGSMRYEELEDLLQSRRPTDAPIFLPYLTGVNPPDYSAAAKGAFLGIELKHDQVDLAHAVEEGIAHLLRRNIEYLAPDGDVTEIVSTGGGAASPYWSQLKADVCGVQVLVPREQEATCRGAAALALVEHGALGSLSDAALLNQPEVVTYQPLKTDAAAARYQLFETYLARLYPGTN